MALPEYEKQINQIKILDNFKNPTLIVPNWITDNATNCNGGYYKIGKIVIVDITCTFKTTSNGGVIPCYLPTAKTENADTFVALNATSLTDNSVAAAVLQNGALKVIPKNTTNTYRISGVYISTN